MPQEPKNTESNSEEHMDLKALAMVNEINRSFSIEKWVTLVSKYDRTASTLVPRAYVHAIVEHAVESTPQVQKIADIIEAGSPYPRFILLTGTVGSGKTMAAAYFAWKMEAYFRSSTEFINEAKNDQISGPASVRFLVIDDLGKEDPAPWHMSVFQTAINHRYANELTTLITTELDYKSLVKRYGQSFVDRITDGGFTIACTGDSKRGESISSPIPGEQLIKNIKSAIAVYNNLDAISTGMLDATWQEYRSFEKRACEVFRIENPPPAAPYEGSPRYNRMRIAEMARMALKRYQPGGQLD